MNKVHFIAALNSRIMYSRGEAWGREGTGWPGSYSGVSGKGGGHYNTLWETDIREKLVFTISTRKYAVSLSKRKEEQQNTQLEEVHEGKAHGKSWGKILYTGGTESFNLCKEAVIKKK